MGLGGGGANSSLHPSFRRKGGAPAPLHPPLARGLVLKVLVQGKLFQRCTDFLYCSVLSLGGKVNARRMSKPDK